jgi:thioredoxin-related protein
MKKCSALLFSLVFLLGARAQAPVPAEKIYHPGADAKKEIAEAVARAAAEHKHVLIQAGGNWCSCCIEFNRVTHTDASIDSVLKACYVVYHLNYSEENQNKEIFAQYGYPQRFGFPVFIILDGRGNPIHTQNSEYLEQGKSYNHGKVRDFLLQWTPQALSPSLYN